MIAVPVPAIPLLAGWFPWLLLLGAPLLLVASVGWRTPSWRYRRLPILALAGAVGTGALSLWVHLARLAPYSFPWSFYVWAGFAVFAVAVAIGGWTSARQAIVATVEATSDPSHNTCTARSRAA